MSIEATNGLHQDGGIFSDLFILLTGWEVRLLELGLKSIGISLVCGKVPKEPGLISDKS